MYTSSQYNFLYLPFGTDLVYPQYLINTIYLLKQHGDCVFLSIKNRRKASRFTGEDPNKLNPLLKWIELIKQTGGRFLRLLFKKLQKNRPLVSNIF